MTQQTLFYRKIAYIVLIAILLFPLYRLGSPSQRQQDGSMSSGGVLAEKRSEGDLSEANIDCFDITTDFTGSGSITVRGGDTNRSLRICYNLSSTGEYIAEDGGVIHIWHQSGSYFGKYKTVRVKNGGGVSSYYSQEIKNVYLGETAADSTFVYGYGYGGESPLVAGTTLQINGTVYCAFRRVGDGNPLRVPKKDSPLPILRGPKGSFAGVDIATQFKLHPLLAKDGVTATFALESPRHDDA